MNHKADKIQKMHKCQIHHHMIKDSVWVNEKVTKLDFDLLTKYSHSMIPKC